MGSPRSGKESFATRKASSLVIRVDEQSKRCLKKAAELRHISVSDYIRAVTVPQAKREIHEAREHVIAMPPDEQLAFWKALNETPVLTAAQRRLAAIMRGEAE